MGIVKRAIERLAGRTIAEQVALAVRQNDASWAFFLDRAAGPSDLAFSERQEQLADALEAWRVNALARRIVALTTDYVVGAGVTVGSSVEWVDSWIAAFWTHPKNRMPIRVLSLCDELTRSGELFPVLSTNPVDGMSYIRSIPARQIDQIQTQDGDYETALTFHQVDPRQMTIAGRGWVAFDNPDRALVAGSQQVMLHLAINRPIGATRGSGDLDPILKWLKRYNAFLEARLALNLHASAFVYDVTVKGATPDQLAKRKSELVNPPAAGSVLVHGDDEVWTVNRPQIAGWDASPDGKAVLGMVATGSGTPAHWLNSIDANTQATASEMGGPALRHYEHRQLLFTAFVEDLVYAALEQARASGALRHRGQPLQRPLERGEYGLRVKTAELDKADNLQLAQSAASIVGAFAQLYDRNLIGDADLVDICYRFAGELVDVEAVLARAQTRQSTI
jgi:hypothetical protein